MASGPSTPGYAVNFAEQITGLGVSATKGMGFAGIAVFGAFLTKAIDIFWRGSQPANQSGYRAAHLGFLDKPKQKGPSL